MSTIFLNRDGVINENRADYVNNWSEFRFLPGSREAIAKLTKAGHRIVVCTKQAGIACGSISMETVREIHHRMIASINEVGGKIEKVYSCMTTLTRCQALFRYPFQFHTCLTSSGCVRPAESQARTTSW